MAGWRETMTIRELFDWAEENGCLDLPIHCPAGYVDEAEVDEINCNEAVCLYTGRYCYGE